jgi:DNA polymerase III subunit delta'
MNAPPAQPPLPWCQRRLYEPLVASLDAGTLGHALLFCGEQRLGKRALVELLAQRVLCTGHGGQPDPCGACRGCRLYRARSQRESLEQRPDGSLAHPDGHPAHPDAVFVGYAWSDKSPPKQLTQITVDQVRALSDRLGRTPQYGDALVVVVEPSDALNESAYNALLKTLEEPVPGRYLWLVSSRPSRLPATIRSRCQRLELRMPPADEALAWLVAPRAGIRDWPTPGCARAGWRCDAKSPGTWSPCSAAPTIRSRSRSAGWPKTVPARVFSMQRTSPATVPWKA